MHCFAAQNFRVTCGTSIFTCVLCIEYWQSDEDFDYDGISVENGVKIEIERIFIQLYAIIVPCGGMK